MKPSHAPGNDQPDVGVQRTQLEARIEALSAQNQFLLAAIESCPAGILIATHPDGDIKVWNSAALGIRDGSEERLTRIPVHQHPDRWQTFRADGRQYAPEELPLSRALLHGDVVHGETVVIRRPNGENRWTEAHAAPVCGEHGEPEAAVVVFTDVTSSKQAHEELDRFRAMAEVSPDFVAMTTPDGELLYLNPGGRALCGDAGARDAQNLLDVLSPPSRDVFHALMRPQACANGVWQGEASVVGADEQTIPVSLVLLAHRDARGDVEYLSVSMRDLRSLRELEGRLAHSQRLQSLGRLAGGIAHDFNNMLHVITGYTRLVRDRSAHDAAVAHDLDTVLDAAARSSALCKRLLGFARQQAIEPCTLDLNDRLRSSVEFLHGIVGQQVALGLALDDDPCFVHIDPAQLDQVLSNLAINARDAMSGRGSLRIQTGGPELLQPAHAAQLDNLDVVALVVTDSGPGVADTIRQSLFEPFVTTGLSGAGAGVGLGLATVHGVVHQNGGQIWLAETPAGEGARFEIALPRS